MLEAILFDLGDTLLENPLETFGSAFLHTFAHYIAHFGQDQQDFPLAFILFILPQFFPNDR